MIGTVVPDESTVAPGGHDETPDPDTPAAEQRDLGLDQIFEILKNQRRRYVLQYLRAVDSQVTLSDLSEQIAAWENEKEVRQITSSERKRVYVGLYQCHLPKMDGMDVVSFNKPRATIEPGRNVDYFYSYLDAQDNQKERPWSRYYIGLSIATVLGTIAAFLIELFVSLPAVAVVTGAALLAFAGTSVAHHWSETEEEENSATTDRSDSSPDVPDPSRS
jgi:hypothetical protein